MERNLKFFLGANTPLGFVSRFDMLNNYELFIIKGGPGTGKSSLMKRVANEFDNTELIYCSSDPNSLDAVILPEQKIAIADGTSPHTLEPRYLGITEHIVNLCGCLDSDKLKQNANELIHLFKKNSLCHTRSCRFLAAASSLISDTYHLSLDVALCEKANKFAKKLAMHEMPNNIPQKSHEDIRFLSAVTSKGITVYEDTAQTLAEKLFVIDDNFGAVSRIILDEIRKHALSKGYDIISCYCPLSPYEKLEHLFIPTLSIGFVTANHFHKFAIPCHKRINTDRFYNLDKRKLKKGRINFNKKASKELIAEAVSLLAEAKATHDEIERHYIGAMNFAEVDKITTEVLEKFKNIK